MDQGLTMSNTLFVNGAIQNRGFNVDDQPGKLVGIQLAQSLNALHGNNDVAHLWNNVGTFHDTELQTPQQRLLEKYQSKAMAEHLDFWGLKSEDVDVLADNDPAFANWTVGVFEKLLAKGTVRIEDAEFSACSSCNYVIGEAAAGITACSSCQGSEICQTRQSGLFIDLPSNRADLLSGDMIFNSMNLRDEQDSLVQLPQRLLLSRDRTVGIPLDDIGLAGKKLEPKMGLGLLALYAAETHDYERVGMVQTTSTLIRTAPFVGSLVLQAPDLPRLMFVPHKKILSEAQANTDTVGRQVVAPLAAAQRKQDVNLQRFTQSQKEFAKLQRNAHALQNLLGKLGHDSTSTTATDIDFTDFGKLISTEAKHSGQTLESLKRKTSLTDTDASTLQAAAHHILLASRLGLLPSDS